MIVDSQPPKVTWLEAVKNASTIAKVYLVGVLIHAVLLVVLSIISLDDPKVDNVYAYLGVFVACCFIYFSFQGVLKDNPVQLRCAILSALLISIYLIWYCIFKDHEIIIEAIGITSGVFVLLYLIMYRWIIHGFGWYRYNRLRIADPELEKMFYTFQVFKAMLLLDIEMVSVMWILIFVKIITSPQGIIFNIVIIVIQFLWSFLGLRAVRTEHLLLSRVFLFLACGMFAYVGFNAYEIFAVSGYTEGTSPNQYMVAMALAVVVRCLLLYWLFKVANNFDKGLKTHVFDTGMEEMDYWGAGTPMVPVATGPELLANASYHLMDEKHIIITKPENEQNSENDDNVENSENHSLQSIEAPVINSHHAKFSKDTSIGTKTNSKYSAEFSISSLQKNKKKNSGIPSMQPSSTFQRARLDSAEFD